MQLEKVIKVAGAFARKENYEWEGNQYEADIKDGDKVTITDQGTEVTGQYGPQVVFSIKTRNGDKNLPLNQSSINILVDAFGGDTNLWVGKEVKVLTKKGVFAGKKGIAAYLVTNDYSLDDFGELVQGAQAQVAPAQLVPAQHAGEPVQEGVPPFE